MEESSNFSKRIKSNHHLVPKAFGGIMFTQITNLLSKPFHFTANREFHVNSLLYKEKVNERKRRETKDTNNGQPS